MREELKQEYFEWLYNVACVDRGHISYRYLLQHLHNVEFEYLIPRDQNRADDGIDMRYRFAIVCNYYESLDKILDILDGPCSVLEMMMALAIRCEENIMDDPNMGNRTAQWFWGMIVSLGLGSMNDSFYDEQAVDDILVRFLNREYEPDGTGGLFTIRHTTQDLRKVEIWHQLCWYLDSIT